MNAASLHQSYVAVALEHINENSEQYFDLARRGGDKGVLWLVLSISNTGVSVKTVSMLPVEAVQSSQNEVLLNLYDAYDEKTQFLCWYLVEDEEGHGILSKAAIVEGTPPSAALDTTPQPQPQPDYSGLVRMTVEIADAASKMSTAIDSLNRRMSEISEKQVTLEAALMALLADTRTAVLEEKVARLEARLTGGVIDSGATPRIAQLPVAVAMPTIPPVAAYTTLDDMIAKFEAKLAGINK